MNEKRGCLYFGTQQDAEAYLLALPIGTSGKSYKSESGKWAVSRGRKCVDISMHPLIRQSYEVSLSIEECEASEKQTTASIKSSELTSNLSEFLDETQLKLKAKDEYLSYLRTQAVELARFIGINVPDDIPAGDALQAIKISLRDGRKI
jgi:hypothetical protein